ncbi:MAG: 50S ribosomal protein L13 [Patescibacteria group bacterium]|nr:50S ribosomal protein L13 [Patescibacteria group bacterium]MBU1349674.1 50S ribosomal protein L13 [Patescibacteria group bacterium]MBU1421144.1 50S ribosomal protein L13 [Patescibacteria group bacterium]MBU1778107.1 50S ribosomal protein L13 [Patescibacteria group bacterium]MBU1987124.1 50S ribosomal protein L13 [Patescibacteria group bacterium]
MRRELHKLDASDQAVGRLATKIAIILRGKNKPEFQPHIDMGDIVEVININKLKFTGKKLEQKKYYKYSGYPGGLKEIKLKKIISNKDGYAEILRRAVKQMLPAVKFRRDMMKRLIIRL